MHPKHDDASHTHGEKMKRILKLAGAGMLALVIFTFGVGVGQGNILFNTPQANQSNQNLPEDLDYADIERVYDLLKANYDGNLKEEDLLDGLKAGLAGAAGDPYTQYFTEQEAEDFSNELNGSFTGIGAELGEDESGNLIIVAPIEGFPASKAGLRPQDVIAAIDGKTTAGMSIDEAVTRIRGEKGTKVKLRIIRDKEQDMTVTIVRDKIKIDSVKWEVIDGDVGYIRVSQFGDDTSQLMEQAAQELTNKNVTSIVLDLRDNPGGLLSSAIEMAGIWLPKGKTVLQEKRGGVVVETYTADGSETLRGLPTAVLINAGSASASEIVAGALRDNKVATIFGEKSYGKGSVQELQQLPGGGELKVTIARWYRPNGQNIDKKGITPDRKITMTDEDYKKDRDPQKDAAIEYVQKQ
jgi:carboxyl-terminal processing protease